MRGKISRIEKSLVLVFVGILCIALCSERLLAAEGFPKKEIKLIVGFSPGGTTDLNSRMLAGLASEDLGQRVIVVNKPGATGTIGAAEVAASKPDGYTVGFFPVLVINLAPFFIDVKYDPVKSFQPIVGTFAANYGFCVQQKAPWKTFKEIIEWARKNPGELSVSTTGKGAPHYPAMEYIAKKEKIKYKHVPYPGGLPSATALLGGHVKAHFGSGSHLPFLYSGQFRMLAAYSPKRQKKFADVPTLKELGYDLPQSRTHLLLAPKGVPAPILKKLEGAFGKAAGHRAYKRFVGRLYLDHDFRNTEAITALVKAEYKQWDEVLEQVGLKGK